MVTDEEEDRDTIGGQAINAFGKFPLLSLARLTTLVGIAAEEDKVYLIFQGVSTTWSRVDRKSRRREDNPVAGSIRP